jgi:hypothetical protein
MRLSDSAATRADIVAAYRLFLSRDPDEARLQHFLALAGQGRLRVADVVPAFAGSREYLDRRATRVVSVDFGDFHIFVDNQEPDFGKAIFHYRSWESHLVAILRASLKAGDVFVDVGANVGVMAFSAAKLVCET